MTEPDHDPITRELLEAKLSGLKSDLRLMIIASVALNQFLASVSLPPTLSWTAIVAAILAPLAKSVLVFFRAN